MENGGSSAARSCLRKSAFLFCPLHSATLVGCFRWPMVVDKKIHAHVDGLTSCKSELSCAVVPVLGLSTPHLSPPFLRSRCPGYTRPPRARDPLRTKVHQKYYDSDDWPDEGLRRREPTIVGDHRTGRPQRLLRMMPRSSTEVPSQKPDVEGGDEVGANKYRSLESLLQEDG